MSARPKRKAAEAAIAKLTTSQDQKPKRQRTTTTFKPVTSSPAPVTSPSPAPQDRTAQKSKLKQKKKPPAKAKVTAADEEPSNALAASSTGPQYWLIKAEPETRIENGVDVKFSIDDLREKKISQWDGVRNFEARNIMRDKMKIGDLCFFYHSNCKLPGIAGIAEVVREGYPDYTAFDPKHPYFDPKSDTDNPKWMMVDVRFVRKLRRFISLKELQHDGDVTEGKVPAVALKDMFLLRRGRLSVQPVRPVEWDYILSLEGDEEGSVET
ncbi:PUA-like domain-containing protein [Fimicolochytrium jonesii]|uniref:PUA-like domain-containing protein n=1 Tax=Fimicolochytrium jonesii TaxID=1396493 RepID=UPI0022FF1626|nr:PUA-like domain-containing protein [Fimicolochytrium jonesii]KAI8819588.1 PUA-like domain-containing protein [Fimicolochytrium jonesii]